MVSDGAVNPPGIDRTHTGLGDTCTVSMHTNMWKCGIRRPPGVSPELGNPDPLLVGLPLSHGGLHRSCFS